MNEELRDLMLRAAQSAPTVRVDENLWRAARRARRRQLVMAPVLAAAVMLGVLGIAWQGSSLLSGEREVGPVTGERRPAMPSHVYSIPAHVVGVSGGEPWPYGGDDSLAVGIGAVALAVRSDGVAVISATDGAYHLLDLPGLAEGGTFRFEDGVIGLSPDGRRLAYTWNESTFGSPAQEYAPSGVRILDLPTGEITSHRIRAVYGVFAHGFSWSPDGRYLAYNLDVANVSQSHVRGSRNFSVGRLDTRTGEWLEAEGMRGADAAPAVTDTGTVVNGSGTTLRTWRPGRGADSVDLARSSRWRGSVVSIGALPGSEQVVVSAGLEYSRLYSGSPDRPASFRRIGQDADRLTLAGPVSAGRQAVFDQSGEWNSLWTIRAGHGSSNDRSGRLVDLDPASARQQYSFATALLGRPTREFPEPDWPMSPEDEWVLAGAVIGGIGVVGILLLRRRRGLWPSRPAGSPGDAAQNSSNGDATS